MRLVPVIGGAILTMISIPSYYFAPDFLKQWAHSFVISMTNGNGLGGSNLLHQMGYPHLSVIIAAFQYFLMGLAWTGIGFVAYGLVAKKKATKAITVKLIPDELQQEVSPHVEQGPGSGQSQSKPNGGQVGVEAVNNVLTKLEDQLKDIKTGYENHKQIIEEEKKNLEQKERERMAKIIAAGEVLIKEISPDMFEDRVRYYIGLKNIETGQPTDLSLLAEKFGKMKKMFDSKGRGDMTSSEFDSFKRFLD